MKSWKKRQHFSNFWFPSRNVIFSGSSGQGSEVKWCLKPTSLIPFLSSKICMCRSGKTTSVSSNGKEKLFCSTHTLYLRSWGSVGPHMNERKCTSSQGINCSIFIPACISYGCWLIVTASNVVVHQFTHIHDTIRSMPNWMMPLSGEHEDEHCWGMMMLKRKTSAISCCEGYGQSPYIRAVVFKLNTLQFIFTFWTDAIKNSEELL